MAVTSVSVYTLPDLAVVYDTNLRPTMTIKLTGGTGPYDITWEWDTSSSFGSGNLVQAFDTGLTGDGPHSKAPGSDLGGAQVWYFRVLVTDTNDSNIYTHPPSGTHSLDYKDVDLTASFLHQQSNVGVGFTDEGADGAPEDKPRFLYQYGNVGVAFGPGLPDGDPKDNPSFLHQYAYLEPTQPCPWIGSIDPTLQSAGSAVTVEGDSFGATQLTWGAEIRLYDSLGVGGSYVTLSPTSWSDQEIQFLVPSGAASGWITVVHTTGTPTCTGSNQFYLTVVQVEPDPETGWFIVATDPTNQTIEVIDGNVVSAMAKPTMNAIGSGRINLPLGDPAIDRILEPVDRVGTLLRVYTDNRFRYAFYAEKLRHEYAEEGSALAIIEGRGMESISQHMMVYGKDWPNNPSVAPTWIYGSNQNFVDNPGFDDAVDKPILKNPGGEDGNDDDGNLKGWSKRGDDVVSYKAVKSVDALEGQWYIEVDASDNHSGITQSITVTPNKAYHVRVYVKDPLASGMRITLALGGADDIEATGEYANNFEYNNEVMAELDNVARNPAHNGLPGGDTDGTWQVLDVEAKTGDEQTSLTIAIMNDHHGTGVFNPFWIDAVEIEGWGLGLDPWDAFRGSDHASNSFRLTDDQTFDGSRYACRLNPLNLWAGVEQIIEVNALTKYTATIWVWTDLAYGDDTYKLVIRANDGANDSGGTQLGIDEKVPTDSGWTQYQVIFETEIDQTEIIFRFAYVGPNNPNPIYLDSAGLVPGEPASNAGTILNDIIEPIQARGTGDFLTTSFTDDLDSNGRAWTGPLAMDIEPGESLYGVLSRMVALGHEWSITPVGFAEGGDTGFELNVWTARAFDPQSGLGVNYSSDPEGPVISPGDATIGGRIVKQVFNKNVVHAIGQDGNWAEAYQEPFLGAGGYDESYGRLEDVIQAGASSDATTLAQFARARIDEEAAKELQVQVKMRRSASLRPFLHFGVGDTLYVDLPPYLGDETHARPKRVRAISADLKDEGSNVTFRVDIDRVIYEDELGAMAAIAQLQERAPVENTGQGTGSVSSSGSVVSGAAGSVEAAVEKHYHALDGTEITDKAASGDVSGTLPGPITVNAVKGMPVSAAIPTVTTAGFPAPVLWVYDRDSKIWTPLEQNTALMTLASIPLDTQRLKYNAATEGFEPEYEWQILPFSKLGAIGVLVGTQRFYATEDRIIDSVRISLGVAGTAATIVDLNIDGTTIFTDQADRPEIAIAGYLSAWETPAVTAWDADSYLTVDIDAGTDGENLIVYVKWRVA